MKPMVVAAVAAGIVTVAVAGPAAAAPAAAAPAVPVFWTSTGNGHGPALDAGLLTPARVAAIVGAPAMTVAATSDFGDVADTLSAPECVSARTPTDQSSYAGSDYTGAATQVLADTPAHPTHTITQAVVAYPSSAQAMDCAGLAARSWKRCAERDLTFTPRSGRAQQWRLGSPAVVADGSVITLPQAAATADASVSAPSVCATPSSSTSWPAATAPTPPARPSGS